MYSCPACGAGDVSNRAACACGADLSLLQRLDSVADSWFNRALDALAEQQPGRALEWLSACCVARPTDAAAARAQAKVWAQLGRWEEAGAALERAAALDPDAPELEDIRHAIQHAVNRPATLPARQDSDASKNRPNANQGKKAQKKRTAVRPGRRK